MPLSALTGTRLRERRLALGQRQVDVAVRAGISASYLNLIEHNRRNVAGAVLNRLADALSLDIAAFSQGHAAALFDDLRSAVASVMADPATSSMAELDRLEDFVGRFPGWAGLVVTLYQRRLGLERALEALSDRMTHDPHLSSALHELLSAAASVRSTAAILAETEDLAPDWRSRFHINLNTDSARLALGAEALVAYLDQTSETAEQGIVAPLEELESWLDGLGWSLPDDGGDRLLAETGALASAAARSLAQAHLSQARADAASLPGPPFDAAFAELGPDPLALAQRFGADVIAVMRRIATRPGSDTGLLICDASGALTFRKPASGFALPRFGAACPLWPLYAALGRPMVPVTAQVEMVGRGGAQHRVIAFCQPRFPGGLTGPDLREAAMLIFAGGEPAASPILIGSTCRICPRLDCLARREPSILSE